VQHVLSLKAIHVAYPEIMWMCRDAKLKTNIIAGWEQDYQPAVTLVEHQFPSGTEP
jgi:hypothetical protein